MQFTKLVIAFVSVVIFSTTFLPRHWWHDCHHHESTQAETPLSDVTIGAEECAICSLVIPWFNHQDILVFDLDRLEFLNQYLALSASQSCAGIVLESSGRAPPVGRS